MAAPFSFSFSLSCLHFVIVSGLFLLPSSAQLSLRFTDPPGTGFLDESIPEGQDLSLGAQRQQAADLMLRFYQHHLRPRGPVVINLSFADLPLGILGEADQPSFFVNPPGAPLSDVSYPASLVNHFAGRDVFPDRDEISIQINNRLVFDLSTSVDSPPSNLVNLTALLAHEVAHGLGFRSNVLADGSFNEGRIDPFTYHFLDLFTGKFWRDLTPQERRDASRRDGFTVYSGPFTRLARNSQITKGPTINRVDVSPGFSQPATGALFGPPLPDDGISAELALYHDGIPPINDACQPLAPGLENSLRGKIALIDRSLASDAQTFEITPCPFAVKVRRAQLAGAVAVIVMEREPNQLSIPTATGDTSDITIPTVLVSLTTADRLRTLEAGDSVFLTPDEPGLYQGQPFINTPAIFTQGSSLSHWHPELRRTQLMNPSLAAGRRLQADLTLSVLRDLGWDVRDIPFPSDTYLRWASDRILTGAFGRDDDADADGYSNLQEYLAATDPTDPASVPLPLSLAGNHQTSDRRIRLTFPQNLSVSDYQYTIRSSPDLQQFHQPLLIPLPPDQFSFFATEQQQTSTILPGRAPRQFFVLEAIEASPTGSEAAEASPATLPTP